MLRGSTIPRWKRHYVSARQPGVLQFTRRRRRKTQEFTVNLEVSSCTMTSHFSPVPTLLLADLL